MILDILKKAKRKLIILTENPVFCVVMLLLMSIGVGLVSLLLGATGTWAAITSYSLVVKYLLSPTLALLNLLPPILMILLVYSISGRAWIAFSFPAMLIILLSIVGLYKVQMRGDPLVATDFAYIREAGNILALYTLTIYGRIVFAIAALALGVLTSVFLVRYRPRNIKIRAVSAAFIVVVSVFLYAFVYVDTELYEDVAVEFWGTNVSQVRKFAARGFMYPFIHSIKDVSSKDISPHEKPDWYDEQEAIRAFESYISYDIPNDKKTNIICIALESYSDFSALDMLDYEIDVFAPLYKLQEESFSGTLITNTINGGTINTERLFLTGNTRLTNYRTETNSYVHYLKGQGYHAEGLHTGEDWFYDRRLINRLLGFDEYYFLEDYSDSNRSDSFFFSALLDLYMMRDKNKPYFSFNLSFQNHGEYDSRQTVEPYCIAQGGMSDEAFNVLNNYLLGIYDTTLHMQGLIDSLRDDPDPVVVVVFGDHMPWLGANGFVFKELGVNINRDTEEGFYNYYSTPYFIWANDEAKDMLSNDFIGDGGGLSPCFLMGEVFRLCSWEGEPYMQALRELKVGVDIINPPTGLFRENGILTSELSQESRAKYLELRMMEYFRLSNYIAR